MFLVNHFFLGTRCFGIKRWLLNISGYSIGERTRIVGPLITTGNLIVGKNCWLGKNLYVNGNGTVIINDNCDIAPEVTFNTGGHKIGGPNRRAGEGEKYTIIVESGCWLGGRSSVTKNTTIGRGCVVASCACVVSDIPPNSMVGGVPAKVIRSLDVE